MFFRFKSVSKIKIFVQLPLVWCMSGTMNFRPIVSNNKMNNLANQKFCDSDEIMNRSKSMLNKFLPVSLKNIFISLDLTTKHESLGFRFCQKAVRFTGGLWCFFGVVRKKQSKDIFTGMPTSLGDLGLQYFLLWGGDLKLSKRLDLKRFCRPLDSFSWSLVCWWLWLHNARLKKSSGDCENTQSSPAGKTSNPDESSDMMAGTKNKLRSFRTLHWIKCKLSICVVFLQLQVYRRFFLFFLFSFTDNIFSSFFNCRSLKQSRKRFWEDPVCHVSSKFQALQRN